MNWGIATGCVWERSWGNVAIGVELGGKRWGATAVVLDAVGIVPADEYNSIMIIFLSFDI